MAAKGDHVDDDVSAQLELAKQKKESAEREYEELRKSLSSKITTNINKLISEASLEPMTVYGSCISIMPMSSDEALEMAAKLILKAGIHDVQALSVLQFHRALVSVSTGVQGEAGRRKEKSTRSMVFRYELEDGEKDLIEGGSLIEGKHRHEPKFWCPRRASDKNPPWYDVPGKFAEFERTAEESARYNKYKAEQNKKKKAATA